VEFLGNCGHHEAERQRGRWQEKASRAAPFEVRLAGGGAYPHAWMARVLWAGIDVDPRSWRRLASAEQEPHLTVARTRQPSDLTGVVHSLATYAGPSWVVEELALVESFLRSRGERGPRYEPQEMFRLTGRAPAPR
jgi:2'-5' RNA ligase